MPRLIALILLALAPAALQAAPAAQAPSAPPRVAVMPFENLGLTGQYDPLARSLADMLTTDLASVSGLSVMARTDLEKALGEQALGQTGLLDETQIATVRQLVNPDYTVEGSFVIAGDVLRLDLVLRRLADGAELVRSSLTGPKDQFFAVEKQAVFKLLDAWKMPLSDEQRAALGRSLTTSLDAAVAYGRSLDLGAAGKAGAALQELAAARDLDPALSLAADRAQELTEYLNETAFGLGALQRDLEAIRTGAAQAAALRQATEAQMRRLAERLRVLAAQRDRLASEGKALATQTAALRREAAELKPVFQANQRVRQKLAAARATMDNMWIQDTLAPVLSDLEQKYEHWDKASQAGEYEKAEALQQIRLAAIQRAGDDFMNRLVRPYIILLKAQADIDSAYQSLGRRLLVTRDEYQDFQQQMDRILSFGQEFIMAMQSDNSDNYWVWIDPVWTSLVPSAYDDNPVFGHISMHP